MVNVYIFNDNNQTTPVIYLTFKDDVRFATFKTPRVVQTNYDSEASSGTDIDYLRHRSKPIIRIDIKIRR